MRPPVYLRRGYVAARPRVYGPSSIRPCGYSTDGCLVRPTYSLLVKRVRRRSLSGASAARFWPAFGPSSTGPRQAPMRERLVTVKHARCPRGTGAAPAAASVPAARSQLQSEAAIDATARPCVYGSPAIPPCFYGPAVVCSCASSTDSCLAQHTLTQF